ncbi:hypothetical protein ACN9M1_19605 [Ralstonia sp. R-29]|uniref:hypothetical protein n=1 Tax=Ralstonia sp. R-29 TaxID=3404059 RepID=UPI003CE6A523
MSTIAVAVSCLCAATAYAAAEDTTASGVRSSAAPEVQSVGSMSPWADTPVGTCIRHFARATRARQAENPDLRLAKEISWSSVGKSYVWIWDDAPSRNPTRTLYKVVRDTACAILFMPFDDGHDFKLGPRGQLPQFVRSTTSPMALSAGGSISSAVVYRFDKKTGTYGQYPYACERLSGEKATQVDCETVFD